MASEVALDLKFCFLTKKAEPQRCGSKDQRRGADSIQNGQPLLVDYFSQFLYKNTLKHKITIKKRNLNNKNPMMGCLPSSA